MTSQGYNARTRVVLAMNVGVWAMIAFTIGLLSVWIEPDNGFQLMGLLMGACFTLVSVLSLFWED